MPAIGSCQITRLVDIRLLHLDLPESPLAAGHCIVVGQGGGRERHAWVVLRCAERIEAQYSRSWVITSPANTGQAASTVDSREIDSRALASFSVSFINLQPYVRGVVWEPPYLWGFCCNLCLLKGSVGMCPEPVEGH